MNKAANNYETPKNTKTYRHLGNRTGVKIGFYILFIFFLFFYFSSLVILIILSFTKHKLDIPPVIIGPYYTTPEIHLVFGGLGPTSTAIVLTGTPLFVLAVLLGYSHLFNYKPY